MDNIIAPPTELYQRAQTLYSQRFDIELEPASLGFVHEGVSVFRVRQRQSESAAVSLPVAGQILELELEGVTLLKTTSFRPPAAREAAKAEAPKGAQPEPPSAQEPPPREAGLAPGTLTLYAAQLRKYAQRTGLSELALARELKVHPATVVNWFRGRTRPTGRMLRRVRQFLYDRQVAERRGKAEPPPPDPPAG